MPRYYASARALDPLTGDVTMQDGRWREGDPMTEVVLRVMRTQRGTYIPDPTFGVDWSAIEKLKPTAGEQIRSAIGEALKRYVDAKQLASVAVTHEVRGSAIRWTLTFRDPRKPGVNSTVNGQL